MLFENLAIFILRLGVAYVYLCAAYLNSRNKASLQWTIETTGTLFSHPWWKIIMAMGGIFLMYLGGISVLFGIEIRMGCLLLIIFTIPASLIHWRQAHMALVAANNKKMEQMTEALGFSAYGAHVSSALKNISLLASLVYLLLIGGGDWQVLADTIINVLN